MTDLSQTIIPKSDQLNSDDLIVGPMTVRITKVSASPSSPEQPVSIFFEGDDGKPYKPCKSMRRVLVSAWGSDGSKYPGRSMTLYRDPAVKWGGIEVGGIRISHLSDIAESLTLALTATRASRKPYTVAVLRSKAAPSFANRDELLAAARSHGEKGEAVFMDWYRSLTKEMQEVVKTIADDIKAKWKPDAGALPPAAPDGGQGATRDEPPAPTPASPNGDPELPRGVSAAIWREACHFARLGSDHLNGYVQTISQADYDGLSANSEALYELFPKVSS